MKYPPSLGSLMKTLSTPSPGRDWTFILTSSFLIFLILLSFALYLFVSVRAEVGALVNGPILSDTQNNAFRDLPAVLEKYQKQKDTYTSGAFSVPTLTDPNK